MSTIQLLRTYVNQRLSMAVEEIIRMFEKTINEYEEEMDRQRRMLGAEQLSDIRVMLSSDTGVSQEIRLLLQGAQNPQKKLSPSLDPGAPEPAHIKEEPEEVYIRQELEGAAVPELHFPPVSVKSEDDEVKLESSLPHQRQTKEIREEGPASRSLAHETEAGAARENWGQLEPAFDLNVAGFLKDTSNGQHFLAPFSDTLKDTEALKNSPNQKKIYRCSACNKTFKHNVALQKHITCHTGESPFHCAECGKTFRQKGSLQVHMRKHTGERPFSCLVCGKNFTQGGTLVAHMRIHTGEKPFSCTVCKKRYSGRGTLFKHMRVHTGEKPFTCSLCGKRFSEKGNLNKHERIHTGEKPFSCSACEKRFSLLSNLKNHKCSGKKSSVSVDQAPQLRCSNVGHTAVHPFSTDAR